MTPATVGYYTTEVAGGLEDYYAGRGEAEGVWLGTGAAAEGLTGNVDAEQLARLFRGEHPSTGEPLGDAYTVRAGADRVTGWDLTFSAPKSVSVLWAVAGGNVGLDVRDAHDAAVRAALVYLEEHAAFSRTGKSGVRQVDTDGLVAAGFVHRQSRAGDPQLHTHVLVSGRVRCTDDGVWRALDSRALHRQLKPAGMLYQAALRAELTARLGVAWSTVDRHGQAEVAGVPAALRRRFSQRRAVAEARVAELLAARQPDTDGELSVAERRRLFQQAVLETRHAKDHTGEGDVGLHDRWHAEAVDAGHGPEGWLGESLHRQHPDIAVDVAAIVAELETGASTWTRADVVKAVTCHAPTNVGAAEMVRAWIEATTDQVLAAQGVIRLTAPELEAPAGLRRRDGMSVFDRHDVPRFSTLATLDIETAFLDRMQRGRGADAAIAAEALVSDAVRAAALDDEQAAAVHTLTTGGDRVAVLVGPAGTGKTRTLAAAIAAWTDTGFPVRGVAVSARASAVLTEETGTLADTIAKLLIDHDHPLRMREVVIVDEAGMAATRDLNHLLDLVQRVEGKLVLVGDPAQLGPVEAGGLFRLLADNPTAVHLSTVRRFHQPWEQDASLRLRAGDRTVLNVYDTHRRIHGGDRLQLEDTAVAAWRTAHTTGESLVITAANRVTVERLNQRIQRDRITAGEVRTVDGTPFGVGDHIVTLRNDRHLVTDGGRWVRNGDRWTINAVQRDGGLVATRADTRDRVVLPGDYVAEHVTLGYAVTTHKAQGVTVDHAICLADETTVGEAFYVAMTRGRHDNHALVITDTLDPDIHRPQQPTPALEVLTAVITRRQAELSATETVRQEVARTESLATLAPRLANLNATLNAERPPDRSIDLQRLHAERRRLEQQLRPGRLTARGRDDRRTLDHLDTRQQKLEAEQAVHDRWTADHTDTFSYRDQLIAAISSRREQLTELAVRDQPHHLVELLGPIPADPDRAGNWRHQAGRIEAYREEWGVEPDDLTSPPRDGVHYRAWNDAIRPALDRQRMEQLAARRTQELDRGIGLEL